MTAPPPKLRMKLLQPVRIGGRHLQPGEVLALPLEVARMLHHQRRARPVELADLALLLAELTPTPR